MFDKNILLTQLNDLFKSTLVSMSADEIEDLRLRLQGVKVPKFTGSSFTCDFGDSEYKWRLICNTDKKRAKIKAVGQSEQDPFVLTEDLGEIAMTVLTHHIDHLFLRKTK